MANSNYYLLAEDGRRLPIGPQGLALGRLSSNDIVINDRRVSRRHARLLLEGDACIVRDEGSAAGTYVNGQRITGPRALRPGDGLQIGAASFKLLSDVTGVAAAGGAAGVNRVRPKQQLALVGVGGTALVLLAIIIAMASGGGSVDLSRFLPPTATMTPPLPSTTPARSEPSPAPSLTNLPPATTTPTPTPGGSITCLDLDLLQARHDCTVTNLGAADILWLAFTNLRTVQERGFALSVVFDGEKDPTFPNARGMVSLGAFNPGETHRLAVQMYCVKPESGCPQTSAHVRLLVRDGLQMISGPEGEFEIQNVAGGSGVKPTRRPDEDSSPAASATSTPSDAIAPTPAP